MLRLRIRICGGRDREEVNPRYTVGMVFEKRPPGLRRRFLLRNHILGNCCLRDIEEMTRKYDLLKRTKTRGVITEITRPMPMIEECTTEQLSEIKVIFDELLAFLPTLYTTKEIEKGMYDRKRASLEKKLASVEKEIERLG